MVASFRDKFANMTEQEIISRPMPTNDTENKG